MRLESLQITNYRVIRRANLLLPDKLIGIIGPNGSGKSTIVEAIAWGLYGHQVARSGKDEIKSTQAGAGDICEVALGFVLRDDRYKVVRRIVGRTDRVEVDLFRNGSRETSGSTDSQEYLDKLLGLDWRGFLTSFLARQQELNALSDLAPAKRRDHLAGMLGIERLDRAITQVKTDLRQDQYKAEFMDRQLAGKSMLQEQIAAVSQALSELEVLRQQGLGARQEAEVRAAETATRLGEHEKRKEACSRYENELSSLVREQALLVAQHAKLEHDFEALNRSKSELAGLEKELSPLPELRAELDKLTEARQGSLLKADVAEQLTRATKELGLEQSSEAESKQELKQIESGLEKLPATLTDQSNQLSDQLEKARDRFAQTKADRDSSILDATKLQTQLDSIAQLGPDAICDHCGRPIGTDRTKIVEHFQTELTANRLKLGELEQALVAAETSGKELRRQFLETEKQLNERRTLATKRDGLIRTADEIARRIAGLTRSINELQTKLSSLGAVAFDPDRFREVKSQVERLQAVEKKVLIIRGAVSGESALTQQLQVVGVQLAALAVSIEKAKEAIAGIGYDPVAAGKAGEEQASALKQLDAAREGLTRIEHGLALKQQELSQRQEQLAILEKLGTELVTVRTRQYFGEKLNRLFGEFRKELIAGIRPRLSEAGSLLMSDMSGGRYQMMELDDEYNIRLFDQGQFFGIDRFSGGETDLANLCLRLAISMTLTESAGLDRSMLILDEVFGSQDDQRRELIYQGLAGLKNRFPQILAITHIEELKHRVETVIELIPTGNGWSEVQIDGHPA